MSGGPADGSFWFDLNSQKRERFLMAFLKKSFVGAALALMVGLVFTTTALAHGHVDVGDYQLVIGFRVEPAYSGEPNGLELVVTNEETGEPVTGLEDSLKVEIVRGSHKQALPLRAMFGEEGAYTADVVPAEAGDYTWHIFGDIEGTPVDVSMTSSPDTFSPVHDKSEIAFPPQDDSAQAPDLGLILGIAGLVAGLAGLTVAIVALRKA
jgi:hypothetical protein